MIFLWIIGGKEDFKEKDKILKMQNL